MNTNYLSCEDIHLIILEKYELVVIPSHFSAKFNLIGHRKFVIYNVRKTVFADTLKKKKLYMDEPLLNFFLHTVL